jgi:predicted Zn-dependent peptidase
VATTGTAATAAAEATAGDGVGAEEATAAAVASSAAASGPEPGVRITELATGVRLVTERMPEARSVTVGFWAGVGSRDEPADLAGASHFLEHLLFKGTNGRSAHDIAVAVDAVGGEMNAFTTREHTAYYTRLPTAELEFGLDLLCDVVSHPAFRPPEIDAEREVIIEEILMNEDTPDDVVHTKLFDALFPDHSLGRETLGSHDTVTTMSRAHIADFHQHWYRPANLVIAAAGDLDHDVVMDRVGAFLDGVGPGARPERAAPMATPEPLTVVNRPTEQGHVALAWRGFDHRDPRRYALAVANQIMGAGMSSRLFQQVREERGLAYTVFSSAAGYSDSGALTIYAGTAPARLAELLGVVQDVIDDLLATGVTDRELEVAKGYLEGATLLGLEDSASRMARLGASMTTRGEVIPVEEHLARTAAVTRAEVHDVLHDVLDAPGVLSVVGPFEADDAVLADAVARSAARTPA